MNVDRNIFDVLNGLRRPQPETSDKPLERVIPQDPEKRVGNRPLISQTTSVTIDDSDAPPSKRFRKNPQSPEIENALQAKPVTPPLAIAEVLPILKSKDSIDCSSTEKPSVDSVELSRKPRLLADRARVEAVTIGNGVFVAPSTSGGLGLFAGKNFENGAFITLYDGEKKEVTEPERIKLLKTLEGWSHTRALSRHEVIFGLKKPAPNRGGGSFVNHGLSGYHEPNSRYCTVDKGGIKNIYIQATKPIKCGREIFANYGSDYWKRFKDALPDEHERIFSPVLRDAIKEINPEILQHLNNIKPVTICLEQKRVPVPDWPELKEKHSSWSGGLSRYALFKMGSIQGDRLSLDSLRLLKPESNEYFFAIAQFILKGGKTTTQTARDWNARRNSPAIPCHAIFKPDTKKWSGFHFNIFAYIYDHDRFNSKDKALMHTIGMLDPSNPIYEQLLTDYIFRDLGINPDEVPNSELSIPKEKLNVLVDKLRRSSSKPLVFLAGHKMPKSGLWSLYYIREFLFRKGVNLEGKRYYPSQINDLMDDKPFYKNAFLLFCRERKCDFKKIFSVTRKEGIRFDKTEGLIFEKQDCNVSALFLQYIHHAGFDYQEVLNSASNEMLCNCIDIIQAEYQGPVSIELLLSLVVSGCKCDEYGKQVVRKYRSRLPENYNQLGTTAVYQKLKQKGEEFRAKSKELARLT